MPVKWIRTADISPKTADFWNCARCLEPTPFENCWSVWPMTVDGKRILVGYIHCGTCAKTNPMTAWMEAHAKDPRRYAEGGSRED